MAKECTPSQFLKDLRNEWRTSACVGKIGNMIMSDLRMGDANLDFWRIVHIPHHIPVKYHGRINAAWREVLIRIAFENASYRAGMAERFKLAQKIK